MKEMSMAEARELGYNYLVFHFMPREELEETQTFRDFTKNNTDAVIVVGGTTKEKLSIARKRESINFMASQYHAVR